MRNRCDRGFGLGLANATYQSNSFNSWAESSKGCQWGRP